MKKFVTLITLMLSFIIFTALYAQNVIQITAGVDQIAAAYNQAEEGDIIELVSDGGVYHETDRLKVQMALTIRGAGDLAEKPIIETDSPDRPFEPTGGCTYFKLADLKITGLVDDGVLDDKDSTKYAMRVRSMDGPYVLVCDNVDFHYFHSTEVPSEGYVIRVDGSAAYASEIRFTNCTFTSIGKHALRMDEPTTAPGQFGSLIVENCTFADIADRGIYASLINDPAVDPAKINVNHCTFTNVGDDAVKINNGVDVTVKNSIFYNINDEVVAADSAEVYTTATVTYCDTLYTDGFSKYVDLTTSDIYAEDPEFADPANYDFTISEFFKDIAKGDDDFVVGDLRWDPENPMVNGVLRIPAGIDKISTAYNYADAYGKDVIELITSGGIYHETDRLKIKMPLTIKAAAGLAEKPIIETDSPDRPFEPTGGCTYFGLSGMKITGIVDDGVLDSKDSTKYAMRVRSMDGPYTVVCDNVDFHYFHSTEVPSEGYVIRVDGSAAYANEIRFTNCMFTSIGKHALRMDEPTAAPGQFGSLIVENCTFADIADRGIYVNLINDPAVDPAEIYVNHCTFTDVGDDGLKINNGIDVTVKNSIFYNINDEVVAADSAEVYTSATVTYCDTLYTDGFSKYVDLTTSDIYAEDPEFAAPANYDFTVSEFFKSIAVGDDGLVVGDLRWDMDNPVVGNVVYLEAGVDKITTGYTYANAYGIAVIELVTNGGIYHETDRLKIKMPLTIRASEGLAEKPIIETDSPDRPFEPTGGCTYFGLFGVKVTGLVDDGVLDSKDSTKYAMRIRSMDGPYKLVCDNVDFHYFHSTEVPSEGYVLRVDGSATYANEIRFTNCMFTSIGKHALRIDEPTAAPGQFGTLSVENCTFADITDRGIYVNLINDPAVEPAKINVNHCTFTNVGDDAAKINNGVDVTVKNSIFYNISDEVVAADSAEVYTSATVTYCDTLFTDGFSKYVDLTTSDIYAEDPEFADPGNYDFTVSEFFKSIAVGDDGMVVGDLRWDPTPTGIEEMAGSAPASFSLSQNYPNPFNPTTTIKYVLTKDCSVKLTILNILGQKVKTLVDEKQSSGERVVHWDGHDFYGSEVASGIYIYRLEAGSFVATKKMLLLR